jgi:hypothetical protein
MEDQSTSWPDKPRYEHQGRNGYSCVDFYRGETCVRNVAAGMAEKDAILMTSALNAAIEEGRDYESQLLRFKRLQRETSV